jgi:predicted ATPase
MTKLTRLLLRWYKSFHLNYHPLQHRGEARPYRPWNGVTPAFVQGQARDDTFPFIEIAIEPDITNIVGANESGKSHLLNAISKVIRHRGVGRCGSFSRTDLCHYANIRTSNVAAWPNIGLEFTTNSAEDIATLAKIIGSDALSESVDVTGALLLAPEANDDDGDAGHLFLAPENTSHSLDSKQLAEVRRILPRVEFLDSEALLPSHLPIQGLIAAYKGEKAAFNMADRKTVEDAAAAILALPTIAQQAQGGADPFKQLEDAQTRVRGAFSKVPGSTGLELLLFRDILQIDLYTLEYLSRLPLSDRGYIEGQVAEWNKALRERLNLSRYWSQDDQFSLSMVYKDQMIYFEVKDKTDSVYTFEERSDGMKFFLSYYLQAKAMEMTSRNKNSVILMDEPDAALSIVGQRNLLAVFESLVSPESSSGTCQLIYTTHSPYLINRNFPRRIRVVRKGDAEEGTQYIEPSRARRYEPVRTALGIDSAPTLFLGSDNILLEGTSDQYILAELIRTFVTPRNIGSLLDLNSVVMVSANGAENMENVLSHSKWADEPIPPTVILLDADPSGHATKKRLSHAERNRGPLIDEASIELISTFAEGSALEAVTVEDIIPHPIYKSAVRAYIQEWLPETHGTHSALIDKWCAAEDFGKGGLVAFTKRLFCDLKPELEGDYGKSGVLQHVVRIVGELRQANPADSEVKVLAQRLERTCDFIRATLDKNRAQVAGRIATQAIKRVINEFYRFNKTTAHVANLQALLKRIENELTPIGADGEPILSLMSQYLSELEKLRAAGHELLTEIDWLKWRGRLDAMKKSPLDAPQTAVAQPLMD